MNDNSWRKKSSLLTWRPLTSCCLALLSLTAGHVRAADVERLPPMVITARAWAESAAHMPASVSIWEPATHTWGMAGGIPDLATETPGVNRTGDGPWAGDLSIRGMTGDRIVVTLDGARLVTANDLAARMALIDWTAVDRVEVFKGPVSSLYGSGSLGGIVNLVLAPPTYSPKPVVQQRLRLGAMQNPDGWMAHYRTSYSSPLYYSSATITKRNADSYRDGDGNRVRNTQFDDLAITVRTGYRWSESADTDLLVQFHRGDDIGIPGSGSAPLPAQADVTYEGAERLLVGLNHRLSVDGVHWQSSRLNVYFQQIERRVRIDNFPGGPIRKITPVGRHDTWGGRWLNQMEWGNHQIGAGIETWRRELDSTRDRHFANGSVQSDRPLPPASEWFYGMFAEDRWVLHPAVSVVTGARIDRLRIENSATPQWDSGSENDWNWNAHTGVRWNLTDQAALRSVLATGYRAPSIEERYQFLVLGDGQVKLGNPDLDAEQSQFAEVGLEWDNAEWSAEISGFVNAMRNRVGEERIDAQTLRNASIERARIQGIEAEATWRLLEPLTAHATLAYLRGDDRRADEPLPDIAPLTGTIGLSYRPVPAWTGRLRYSHSARQSRVPDNMEETPSWGRLDASVTYTLTRRMVDHEFRLDLLNVTDATYRDHLSTWRGTPHNEPGRSIQISWMAQF